MKIQKTHFLAIGIATAIFALSSGVQAQETKTFTYTESNVTSVNSASTINNSTENTATLHSTRINNISNSVNNSSELNNVNSSNNNQVESAAPDLKTVASNIGGFFSNIGSALKSGIQKVGSTTGHVLQSAGEGLQKASSSDKTPDSIVSDNQTPSNERLISLGKPTTDSNSVNSNTTSVTTPAVNSTDAPTTSVGERMNADFSIAKDKVSSMVTTIRNKVTNTPEKSTKNDRITNTLF